MRVVQVSSWRSQLQKATVLVAIKGLTQASIEQESMILFRSSLLHPSIHPSSHPARGLSYWWYHDLEKNRARPAQVCPGAGASCLNAGFVFQLTSVLKHKKGFEEGLIVNTYVQFTVITVLFPSVTSNIFIFHSTGIHNYICHLLMI